MKVSERLRPHHCRQAYRTLIPGYNDRNSQENYRGCASFRGGHNSSSFSVNYRVPGSLWHDWTPKGEVAGGDVVDFVRMVRNCGFKEACRSIFDVTGIDLLGEGSRRHRPKPISFDELLRAELFRTRYAWFLDHYLTEAKEALFLEDEPYPRFIAEGTAVLDRLKSIPARDAVWLMRKLRYRAPHFVERCIAEARDFQIQLACAFRQAGDSASA